MKNLILGFFVMIMVVTTQAGTYYDSVIECKSETSEISKLNLHVKSTGLYKKDRVKGSAEFADFGYALSNKSDMCEFSYLKISLEQYKELLGRDRSQYTFPMNLNCVSSSIGMYRLSGFISIDSSHKAASVVYSDEAGLKNINMKCEAKSILDRVADSLIPEFGS